MEPTRYSSIRPGQVWLDTEGKRIQAHGGSQAKPPITCVAVLL